MATENDHDALLAQFRQRLVEQDLIHDGDTIGTDDATLLRFLRARQSDLDAAITMWKNCYNWRKTVDGVGIDELYRQLDPFDYPEREEVFKCWPLWFHKTDKLGRPLNIHHFGGINMQELYKHITPEKFWQTIVVNAESLTREILPAAAQAAGKDITGTFVIVDLKGFSIRQFWQMQNLARDSFQISQDYFPETMAHLAIVNAPTGFSTIWNFIKPWLAKETVAKVEILGSNFAETLLAQIPAENLPESLGGTCTCAEFGGCERGNAGPWMDDRKDRRERWLRGEAPLQKGAAELQQRKAQEEQDAEVTGDGLARQGEEGAAVYGRNSEVVDAEGGAEKSAQEPQPQPDSERESTGSSSMPATPPDDEEISRRMPELSIDGEGGVRKQKSQEASVENVYRDHPETRQVQTGDLHK